MYNLNLSLTDEQVSKILSNGTIELKLILSNALNAHMIESEDQAVTRLNCTISIPEEEDKKRFIRDFPIVTESETRIALKFLKTYVFSNTIDTNDKIYEKAKILNSIPYAAFVGITGNHYFDNKKCYMTDHGFFGKLNEYLFTGKLPNSSKEKDSEYLGEIKTVPAGNIGGILNDIDICLLGDQLSEKFIDTHISKKIESGITIFTIEPYKDCKRLSKVYYLDTKPGSYLHNEFTSDYECGDLNQYNCFLKKGTKNSGKTITVKIPKKAINEHAILLHAF